MDNSSPLTIVMYHYVRDLQRSRYPAIKALDLSDFRGQLAHIKRHYTPVTAAWVADSLNRGEKLPVNAVWLTFDDGYIDHYSNCFPLLHDAGIEGTFFPAVSPVENGCILDVNRVHFLLAVANIQKLCNDLDNRLQSERFGYSEDDVLQFRLKWAVANWLDDAETIYFKRMLQTALPDDFRREIASDMFRTYVSHDEVAFAQELYMSPDQLRVMQACGMYIGCHGVNHHWMNRIDRSQQQFEIQQSLSFLKKIGSPVDDYWICSYPYGAWNDGLLEVLVDNRCSAAVTSVPKICYPDRDNRLLLPRLDTNDIPKR